MGYPSDSMCSIPGTSRATRIDQNRNAMNTHTMLLRLLCITFLPGALQVTAQPDTTLAQAECSLLLLSGKKLQVDGIRSIASGRLEYELEGSLHDLTTAEIRTIRCGGVAYAIINDTLRSAAGSTSLDTLTTTPAAYVLRPDGKIDYRTLGKADAKQYYRGEGNFVAGMLTAPFLIPPLIIACVPPTPGLKHNPNAALYYTQPEYRKGYRGLAHGKKAGLTIGGMSLGLVLFAMIAVVGT